MRIGPYRQVLAMPGMRSLMLLAIVARVPVVAAPITLTLHVVLDLDRGYAAAGLLASVLTLASTVGAPLLGRLIDRRSLRMALAASTVAEILFWSVAPVLPYPVLLVAGAVLGLLTMPVFSVVRQSIAALVPEESRRPAYALDSMAVELSFMVGPALAVLLVTQISATATMYLVGAAIVLAGIGLYIQNPPMRTADEEQEVAGVKVPRREWLRPAFVSLLVLTAATTAVLAASDIALVAELRASGDTKWIGLIMAVWAFYSIIGGFVYGSMKRVAPTVVLVALIGLFTIPISLVDGVLLLALVLIPAGALCAPSLASSADAVSRLVPAGARGEAMGLYNSALTLGLAIGAPVAGAVVDAAGPSWGFVAVGAGTLTIALAVYPFVRHSSAPTGPEDAGAEGAGPEGAGREGAGPESAGPESAGPEGAGPESAGPEGAGPEDAGPESAGPGTAPDAGRRSTVDASTLVP
ncbi:MFS transporter [Virgisporangium ochraceum]|uniref:MFS transporter n=1 Tax=Virgisporangium ochraceum TaxID=65505 RepID=A0A8J4EC59_9ACTN|nr:MFS transporter [Virgisporangium ochraceum]GIJ69178.1 MFS transporter [Virgisporangium ochraceum]